MSTPDQALHLAVIQPIIERVVPPCWNPERFDFYWNDDYTAFRLVRLSWWDEASYAAYQAAAQRAHRGDR